MPPAAKFPKQRKPQLLDESLPAAPSQPAPSRPAEARQMPAAIQIFYAELLFPPSRLEEKPAVDSATIAALPPWKAAKSQPLLQPLQPVLKDGNSDQSEPQPLPTTRLLSIPKSATGYNRSPELFPNKNPPQTKQILQEETKTKSALGESPGPSTALSAGCGVPRQSGKARPSEAATKPAKTNSFRKKGNRNRSFRQMPAGHVVPPPRRSSRPLPGSGRSEDSRPDAQESLPADTERQLNCRNGRPISAEQPAAK